MGILAMLRKIVLGPQFQNLGFLKPWKKSIFILHSARRWILSTILMVAHGSFLSAPDYWGRRNGFE